MTTIKVFMIKDLAFFDSFNNFRILIRSSCHELPERMALIIIEQGYAVRFISMGGQR